MITILAALNDEVKLILSEMEIDKTIRLKPLTISTGKYLGRPLTVVKTGVGKEAMRSAMNYLASESKPSMLINVGYAGGLVPNMAAGDIVIASSCIDDETEKVTLTDGAINEEIDKVLHSASIACHTGRIVTVAKAITDPHGKAFAGTKFESIACDMESAPFAEMASSAGIRFAIVRAILDPMDITLPDIPEEAVTGGEVHIGPMIDHLKSNPKDLFKLPKFSYLASQARLALTGFVREWTLHEAKM